MAATLGTDSLDEVVRLLLDLDQGAEEPDLFYDRICEAICRLTSMERAILLLHDPTRRLVLPAGSHGVEPELLAHTYGTLEETPIAQRALSTDAVVETDDLAGSLPARYAALPGVTALTCTPVSAAGRWLGVIFADRAGEPFDLVGEEAETMRALGRTAALATHVRQATIQRERGRRLSERIALAREVHERVMQRLFGVSLALGSGGRRLPPQERKRCASEVEAALVDLREALTRSLDLGFESSRTTLEAELQRLGGQFKQIPLRVSWGPGARVPDELEPLAVSVLSEALRNAEKHARPREVRVSVSSPDGVFALEIRNDGLSDPAPGHEAGALGAGIGLRLASYESLQRGGMLEFGRDGPEWRVRLVLPAGDERSGVETR